jgi:hypothetical protein
VHVFLEGADEPVAEEFDAAALAGARQRLKAMIGRIRAGEFKPTDEPTSAICFGCPAAARLCLHPKWRPPAAPGAPPREEPAAPEPLAGEGEPAEEDGAAPKDGHFQATLFE